MTLADVAISMLNNISPCVLKHKTFISSIQTCYTRCQMYIHFHLKRLLLLKNSIILTNSGCDTLRAPCVYFRPFANSVRDTKYHKPWSKTSEVVEHLLLVERKSMSIFEYRNQQNTITEGGNYCGRAYLSCIHHKFPP